MWCSWKSPGRNSVSISCYRIPPCVFVVTNPVKFAMIGNCGSRSAHEIRACVFQVPPWPS